MKSLPLGRGGLVTLVDDEDYEWASQWRWSRRPHKRGAYACRLTPGPRGSHKATICLHREVLARQGVDLLGRVVDHIDGDGLNNTRKNLRSATLSQNAANSKTRKGYKGVQRSREKWKAAIRVNYKAKHLGTFDTEEEAARAYDAAAREAFDEFAKLNFPDEKSAVGR